MEHALQLAVLVFAALATSGLMVDWMGLGRARSRLSVSTYVEFRQATDHSFDPYMPIVVVGVLLGSVALAIFSHEIRSLSGELAIAGSICYVGFLTIAFSTNVRVDKQIVVRTLFSLLGLACYILACLLSR